MKTQIVVTRNSIKVTGIEIPSLPRWLAFALKDCNLKAEPTCFVPNSSQYEYTLTSTDKENDGKTVPYQAQKLYQVLQKRGLKARLSTYCGYPSAVKVDGWTIQVLDIYNHSPAIHSPPEYAEPKITGRLSNRKQLRG